MLPGFTGETLSLAWNPSKDIIATGGRDGIIRTWDILTGNPLVTINHNEHESEIESIIWTPDGRSLISPGYGSIWWWEATTGNLIKVVYTDAGLEDYTDPTVYREMDIDQLVITSIDISPDSMVLASVGWDKIIRLWDMSNDQALSEWSAHSEWIDEVIWHPKQQRIATSSFDCTIRIWDTEKSGELIYTLYGHSSFVKDIDWSPDGKYITSVSDDGTVHIWDNETGYPVVIIDEQSSMSAGAWNPIYEILAIGRLDGIVTIWDTNKWIPVSELRIETSNNDDSRLPAVVSIEWSTNGDYLAIASRDGTVRIFTYQFK